MEFISRYLKANEGTAVPTLYHAWAAVSLINMILARRVYVDHGYFQIRPMMYMLFVGAPSIKKTTALVAQSTMFQEVWPDHPLGASITTREDIVKRMSSDECLRTYTDELGSVISYKPFYLFVDEFANFLSFNPVGMVQFLTGIYDTKFFDSSTIVRGKEPILNPCLNFVGCTTPKDIHEKFKSSLVGGGFSRRMILIHEPVTPARVAFPFRSQESIEAWDWCIAHLRKISTIASPVIWDPTGRAFFRDWYEQIKIPEDPILEGYYGSKDIIMQKIAIALCASQEEPNFVFTKPILEAAIAMLESNEENLPSLTVAAGRNELAAYQHLLLVNLSSNSGMMTEKRFHMMASSNMTESEYISVKNFLKTTDQIYEVLAEVKGKNEVVIVNKARYDEIKKKGEV
jgi:hypothetical protein